MSAEVFIDTNVFIYHLDGTDFRKHTLTERIVRDGLASGDACISLQVVQECLNTALHKAEVALSADAARSYLDTVLAPFLNPCPALGTAQGALLVRATFCTATAFQPLEPWCLDWSMLSALGAIYKNRSSHNDSAGM